MKSRLIFLSLSIWFFGVSLLYGQKPLQKPVRVVKPQKVQQPKQKKESLESLIQSVSGTVNGHDYVDLGLSVKWATCNVGANSPEKYGNYYAWGEIGIKSYYSSGNSMTYNKEIGNIAGSPKYDVARARWGEGWRLPTKEEIEELKTKCKIYWTIYKGVKGYLVERKGKYLFLPAAGYSADYSLDGVGKYGNYWSSTSYDDIDYSAYRLYFTSSDFYLYWGHCYSGFSVRPVID